MEVYRISKAKYAERLRASGNPARWNYAGERVVYAASSRSLAALELLVHLSGLPLQHAFRIMVIEVPDDLVRHRIERSDLPEGWNGLSPYATTQALGSAWLRSRRTCVMRVPSSLIPQEYNYVLNEQHPDFGRLSLQRVEAFAIDPRLLE